MCMYSISKYILNKYLHGVGIIHHITGNHLPVNASDGSGMNPFWVLEAYLLILDEMFYKP